MEGDKVMAPEKGESVAGKRRSGDALIQMAYSGLNPARPNLVVPGPPKADVPWMEPCEDVASPAPLPSEADDLARFKQGLTELRARYRPFLQDCTPPSELSRTRRPLDAFAFRYRDPNGDQAFSRVLKGEGMWEPVTIPDFRGPTGQNGRWTGYYRAEFPYPRPRPSRRVFLVFEGVDYRASVYLNQRCVGAHEGFFSPFAFDVTDVLAQDNVLVVEVSNDFPAMGVDGTRLDGDKLYAATGPGWDDPEEGWHHCPPGAGIYHRVYLEERPTLFIHDIFVRPDLDDRSFEAWVEVFNVTDRVIDGIALELNVYPANFSDAAGPSVRISVPYAGPGRNDYRVRVSMPSFRVWDLEEPYLYTLRVRVRGIGDGDVADRTFGMRKFHMDETTIPKGTLYLNNRPIILRGTNEMGHLQQCLMRGDMNQLVDDIFIAKLAHLNFFRVTQRPVPSEIYDVFDRLGMLHQCDLPLFGVLRRNQFTEALRQTAEMERMVRAHPSAVIVSFINEATSVVKHHKGHRHLFRDELERFFLAARQVVRLENPDRVIKEVEGDYEPPSPDGLSDFHLYTLWYTNHMLPMGCFYRGFLPPIRRDWKAGCGEYGAEGLDYYDLMKARYPAEWLPASPAERWMPNRIPRSQTYGLHGDWFEEPSRIDEWIVRSQTHQARSITILTDGLRRRADVIVSSAVHLLIDAWPGGWMKALVGVDRKPKPAYFALARSLVPLRAHLRWDRWTAYADEFVAMEVWLLNDTSADVNRLCVVATIRDDCDVLDSFRMEVGVAAASASWVGRLGIRVPRVTKRTALWIDVSLRDAEGREIHQERFTLTAFGQPMGVGGISVRYLGSGARSFLAALSHRSLESLAYAPFDGSPCDAVVVSGKQRRACRAVLSNLAAKGTRVLELADDDGPFGPEREGFGESVAMPCPGVFFLAFDRNDPRCADCADEDFAFLYNRLSDRIDFSADRYGVRSDMKPLLFGYEPSWHATAEETGKPKRAVIGTISMGAGEWIVSFVPLSGRLGWNPALDGLFLRLLRG